ncbi:MarR family winged helix-turn-helix transcriptional regulator [Pelagibacterium halotolerans]|uniref:Transcriptional regulator, MarR family n=1 Tax=Pelagibacterium halotolerans (strain DSM 22347 / JCM 15775 / CGMCC 1.7692 / B2) TaxID=1082931 RepID=G4R7V6_PELHB|nr:MarR family winged helix-turn-helix transcriptional regulator [Pelagibacterium halotolerans]AEQ50251.1 transcriptional regulator, MarR family [Pelagibacterium halotolerans B2]QJR19754.1 winged helix-turn-helix transcriptional regulator [Pelagibacterium halotolerans]SEA51921.1 transcriptional regulator, MarR family [Pelagibacterium halotolerans]
MSAVPGSVADETMLETGSTTDIVGYRLRRAQLSVFQRFLSAFEALDLRPAEYSALALIGDNPGRKQTEIAEILGIKRANFVALINGLEARGLTERRAAHGDRRANALYLTEEGAGFVEKARAVQDDFEADCIARLGGTDARDTLLDLLGRLC